MNILKADQEIYAYGIELILGDILNLFILLIVACAMNRIMEMVIWSGVFLVTRRFTGGYHSPSQLLCILTIQIGFIISVLVCEILKPSAYFCFEEIVVISGILITVAFGPVGSPKKPVTTDFYRKKKKELIVFVFIITGLFVLMIDSFPESKTLLYAFTSYTLAVILVPIGYADNKIRFGIGSGVADTNIHL